MFRGGIQEQAREVTTPIDESRDFLPISNLPKWPNSIEDESPAGIKCMYYQPNKITWAGSKVTKPN